MSRLFAYEFAILKKPQSRAIIGCAEHLPTIEVETSFAVEICVMTPEMDSVGELAQVASRARER